MKLLACRFIFFDKKFGLAEKVGRSNEDDWAVPMSFDMMKMGASAGNERP